MPKVIHLSNLIKTVRTYSFLHLRSHSSLSTTSTSLSRGGVAGGIVGLLALTLTPATIYNIYNVSSAFAADASDTKSLDFTVISEKSIDITLSSSSVALSIQPTAEGKFGRSSLDVNVSTNNTTGYNLTMQASTDTLTRSTQVNNTTYTITPLSQSITCTSETASSCTGWTSSYANNQWGYRIDNGTTYTSMTGAVSNAATIKTTSASANTSSTTVYFGAKLDNAIPVGSYEGVTLTFMAVTNPIAAINDMTYLQEFYGLDSATKNNISSSMTTNVPYKLVDSRDGTIYNIAKLADGNIWFLDNLRLDLTNNTVKTNLTPTTTNATDTALNCLKNGNCSSPYSLTAVSGTWGDNTFTDARINTTYATTINSDSSKNYGDGSHMYGVYYNFCAASAGSYCYAGGASPDGVNASEDICPAGWHMPTADSWGVLRNTINSNTASNSASIQARLSLPLSGYFNNGSANGQGSGGFWWSSTWGASYDAMSYFNATATLTKMDVIYRRYLGYSMRCLMPGPKTIDDVSTLQDFALLSADDKQFFLDSMTENQVYEKTDSRDGQTYKIAKLADGNIWFLDNLRLDLTKSSVKYTISPADTNASQTAINCLTGRTTGCASPYTTAAVSGTWSNAYTGARINTTYATTIDSDSSKNYGNGSHIYGVYYNYCAASAGSYCYASGAGTGNASEDICPAGWRMPTGDADGEWGALDSLINNRTASDSASIQARLSLPLSGGFYDGSASEQGLDGYWWSSTRNFGDLMYRFYADTTSTDATNSNFRDYGLSLRCLFSAS